MLGLIVFFVRPGLCRAKRVKTRPPTSFFRPLCADQKLQNNECHECEWPSRFQQKLKTTSYPDIRTTKWKFPFGNICFLKSIFRAIFAIIMSVNFLCHFSSLLYYCFLGQVDLIEDEVIRIKTRVQVESKSWMDHKKVTLRKSFQFSKYSSHWAVTTKTATTRRCCRGACLSLFHLLKFRPYSSEVN